MLEDGLPAVKTPGGQAIAVRPFLYQVDKPDAREFPSEISDGFLLLQYLNRTGIGMKVVQDLDGMADV